ncbi:MAG: sulfotransferase family 2 domain-containing protein [Chryseolinea sp.]
MKLLQFLFLIFTKGSLNHSSFNFEEERRKILASVPNKKLSKDSGNANKIKSKLLNTKIGYSLISNLSYFRHARQMNVMLFVSSAKQLVYIRILKSASTSLLKELLPTIDKNLEGYSLSDDQVDALAFRYLKKELTLEEEPYSKFALIRNPFHRIVSVYLDLFDPKSDHFSYESYWFGILKSKMTFQEFVETISQIPNFLKGPHFAPQQYILSNITPLKKISYFRIEKDQEALNNFLSKHGINLPHRNRHGESYNHLSFYTTYLVNKVYDMYEQDVVIFDYKAEYNQLLNFVSNQENRMV